MRVLIVVHGYPPWATGGTELYVRDFARALVHRGNEVFVLTREADPARPEYHVRSEVRDGVELTVVNNTFARVTSFEDGYRNPAICAIGGALTDRIRPDVAHIHHLTCLSSDLPLALAERDVPTLVTLHDYWFICHRGQLFDLDHRVCAGPGLDGCRQCVGLSATPALPGGIRSLVRGSALLRAMAARLEKTPTSGSAVASAARARHMRLALAPVDHFLALSDALRERFIAFGLAPDRIATYRQGVAFDGDREPRPEDGPPHLRIGFFGSLMVSKAPHLLLEAHAGLPPGSASVDLFGAFTAYHGDDTYRAQLQPLLARPGVRHHGEVPHEQVADALRRLDVVVVPSVWPENSPLVVREAFAAGVPVVAARIGGLPEMVTDGVNGLLFAPGDKEDLRRALARLIDDPGLLPALRSGIPPVPSIHDDVEVAHGLYERARQRASRRRPAAAQHSRTRVAAVVLNYQTPDETIMAVRALESPRSPVRSILVVDNGSGGASLERIRACCPAAIPVPLRENVGFAAGCNAGIRRALDDGADAVLLVNSDAIVPPRSVARMVATLASDPRIGIVGPVIVSRADPDRVTSMGMRFSPRSGRMRHHGFGMAFGDLAPFAVREVDAISGCAMLVTRAVFERAGLLDEDFFFSFEDLEFCLRARRHGFRSAIAGDAIAYHEGGRSIGAVSASRHYHATRNHLLAAERGAPLTVPGATAVRAGAIVALNLAFAMRSARRLPAGAWNVLRGAADYAALRSTRSGRQPG